jgi:hypothetical protein
MADCFSHFFAHWSLIMARPKLAIYGDSFADPNWVKQDYPAWTELLAQDYDIANYAYTGTGMWWSYDKFTSTYGKYDKYVFVATVPGRIHIEYNDTHLNLNPVTWPVWDSINIGEMYFRYFYSGKREEAFHNFMINDLLLKDDVLIVPAFKESVPNLQTWSLCHFADSELRHYGLVHAGANEHRKCHMSEENNKVVYAKIKSALADNSKVLEMSATDFVPPTSPLERYWK